MVAATSIAIPKGTGVTDIEAADDSDTIIGAKKVMVMV